MISVIDEVKSRLDIAEVVGNYIKLQKAGANFRAPCPFHAEKKPSLFVSPARQIWHCFGCGKGGSIFNFVMEIEGVEFGDALRILAQKAGVELKQEDPKIRTEKERLYEICELSTKFFEKQLEASSTGREARDYLLGRGINDESIKKWRLGYSPETWQGLSDFLVGKGYKREEIERAGLAIRSEKRGGAMESYYDRFRGRIMFPVFDINSQVIGFGGRIFKIDDPAKYINTPNTLLYDKSHVLYGLNYAKVDIRKKDYCIMVEGYTDVIMISQAGFANVVAASGTALSQHQLIYLKRYSENLYTAFDMDIAGDSATKRGIDLAQSQGFNIKVITMQEGLDPADIVAKDPQEWEKSLTDARSIMEYYFQTTFAKFDKNSPEGKKEISKALLPQIKRIPNEIVLSHWVQELSKKLGIKEEVIESELKKVRLDDEKQDESSPVSAEWNMRQQKPRKEMLEERIASLLLKHPQHIDAVGVGYFPFFSQKVQAIFSGLRENPTQLSERFNPEEINYLDYLSLKAEVEDDGVDPREEILDCLKEIKSAELKSKQNEIQMGIKMAEAEKDYERVNNLMQEFNIIAQELTNNQTL